MIEAPRIAKRIGRWAMGAGLLLAFGARAAQSENHLLHAVPPPRAVVLDGRLDDWDLSGQIEMFANARLRNSYSAKVAAMHDQDNFYLAVQWRDATPLFNMIDARHDLGAGWRGDCLQLRVLTDVVMHIDCWYSLPAEKSVVRIVYGSYAHQSKTHPRLFQMLDDAIAAGARQAFTRGEDGQSYTQEIAIPWRLLTGAAAILKETGKPLTEGRSFAAGDSFSMGMEFLWSGPDGKTWPVHRYADLLQKGATSREFFWTREKEWGTVKLMAKGNLDLPKPDLGALDGYLQKTEGPVAIRYEMPFDGFATLVIEDEKGNRVRNLIGMAPRAKGNQTDFWDGINESGQVAAPGAYRWRGLVHQGIDPVYEATYGSPGLPPWDTADGKGAWMSDHNAPCAVATGNGRMFLAAAGSEAGWALIGADLDGRKLWGERKFDGIRAIDTDGEHVYIGMSRWVPPGREAPPPQIGRCFQENGAFAPFATAPEPQLILDVATSDEKATLVGLAVGATEVAVALAGPNVVRFLDKNTAAQLRDVPVPDPAGLDYSSTGEIFVISGKTVARLEGNKLTTIVASGLEYPVDLAVAGDGTIYVSDKGSQQVKVFGKDGKLGRAIGRAGGRPQPGLWVADSLRLPAGLDLDEQGRLWVAEEDMMPKRISVWNPDGTLAMDMIGPTTYGGKGGFVDPDDKTRLFGNGVEWKLDYETNTATPVATRFAPEDFKWTVAGGTLFKHGGHEYFQCAKDRLFIRRGEGFVACAAFGNALKAEFETIGVGGKSWFGYAWSDLDEDGQMQPEEVAFRPAENGLNSGYWGGRWLDDEFNAILVPGGYGDFRVVKFPFAGWTKGGVPRWDLSKEEVWFEDPGYRANRKLLLGDARRGVAIAGATPIRAYRADGSLAWTYANPYDDVHGSHRAPVPERDDLLVGPIACIGVADAGGKIGRLFAMNSNMGRAFILTTDGLFVASVFQDFRAGADPMPEAAKPGMPLGGVSMACEWFGGYFFKSPQDEYYLIAGFTAFNLIRLRGLETLRPLEGGALAFTVEDVKAADALQRQQALAAAKAKELTLARLEKPPVLDGKLDEYPKERFVEWNSSSYRVRGIVAVEDGNLCLGWEVHGDTSPMRNAGKDPLLLFTTGDSVDLQLGTHPDADPKRTGPVPGDLRLLISEFEGQPTAVLYRWKATGEKKPEEFRSPWRSETLEFAAVLDSAQVKIAKRHDGYTVEAVVPLDSLGFAPQGSKTYKLDMGVIYSNAEGNTRAARVYWANQATGLVSDIPGEIMAHPNLWGTATFE